MADSTLAALSAHTTIVDADSSYIEDAGVAKKVAASVWKTYCSLSPTLVTPDLGTPTAGDISACTSSGMVLTGPVLGTPSSGDLSNCTGGPTLTSATLITPLLGTPVSGDLSNCTGSPTLTLAKRSVATGLTADAGSAQGGTPLTKDINEISTCATIGDSVTLPSAVAGLVVTIINNGANAADVFPASGDDLGAGVDTAASLAAGANITYMCLDTTTWFAQT